MQLLKAPPSPLDTRVRQYATLADTVHPAATSKLNAPRELSEPTTTVEVSPIAESVLPELIVLRQAYRHPLTAQKVSSALKAVFSQHTVHAELTILIRTNTTQETAQSAILDSIARSLVRKTSTQHYTSVTKGSFASEAQADPNQQMAFQARSVPKAIIAFKHKEL